MPEYVEMPMDDYKELLYERRDEVEPRGWTIPDAIFDYLMELVEDAGYLGTASYVIDNVAINGDFGPVSKYPHYANMTHEELEDEVIFTYEDSDYPGETCILLNLGL